MASKGKRAGSRRTTERTRPSPQPALFGLAAGVTLSVVAWGYLVYSAVDFGSTARGGNTGAWWMLGLASIGAVACLFVGLMLVARLLRALGITSPPPPPPPSRDSDDPRPDAPQPPPKVTIPRPPGGRRAAR